jgi:hypothetical protein
MSYIKSLLPDDWEPDPYLKKYLCIGTEFEKREIKAQWLPRWYNVPYDECLFTDNVNDPVQYTYTSDEFFKHNQLIILIYRPDGDYQEHLKILKTERLLDGTGIHE